MQWCSFYWPTLSTLYNYHRMFNYNIASRILLNKQYHVRFYSRFWVRSWTRWNVCLLTFQVSAQVSVYYQPLLALSLTTSCRWTCFETQCRPALSKYLENTENWANTCPPVNDAGLKSFQLQGSFVPDYWPRALPWTVPSPHQQFLDQPTKIHIIQYVPTSHSEVQHQCRSNVYLQLIVV